VHGRFGSGNPPGRSPFQEFKCGWKDDIKRDIERCRVGCYEMDLTVLKYNPMANVFEHYK
jgi:hypothetical protein